MGAPQEAPCLSRWTEGGTDLLIKIPCGGIGVSKNDARVIRDVFCIPHQSLIRIRLSSLLRAHSLSVCPLLLSLARIESHGLISLISACPVFCLLQHILAYL